MGINAAGACRGQTPKATATSFCAIYSDFTYILYRRSHKPEFSGSRISVSVLAILTSESSAAKASDPDASYISRIVPSKVKS